MQDNPPESNFRPQSPVSLYSYVAPLPSNFQQANHNQQIVQQQQQLYSDRLKPQEASQEASSLPVTKSILKNTHKPPEAPADSAPPAAASRGRSSLKPSTFAKTRFRARQTSVSGTAAQKVPEGRSSLPAGSVASRRAASADSRRASLLPQTPGTNKQQHPPLVRNTTVAFGRTTLISQTIEASTKNKAQAENPLANSAFLRAKQYKPGLREMEELQKKVNGQAEEIATLKAQNETLVQAVELLSKSVDVLRTSMEEVTSRLSEWEKARQESREHQQPTGSKELDTTKAKETNEQKQLKAPVPGAGERGEKKQRPAPAPVIREAVGEVREKNVPMQVTTSPKKQHHQQISRHTVPEGQGGRALRNDEKKLERLLGFIGQRIREDPDFGERINRTVELFGRDYSMDMGRGGGGAQVSVYDTRSPVVAAALDLSVDEVLDTRGGKGPSNGSPKQRAQPSGWKGTREPPMGQQPKQRARHFEQDRSNDPLNTSRPSGYYTQRVTLQREITTYSPDRAHLGQPHLFGGLHNLHEHDQSRRAAYRHSAYGGNRGNRYQAQAAGPHIREYDEDEEEGEPNENRIGYAGDDENGNNRNNRLLPLPSSNGGQKRETVPMSDDESFFDDNAESVPVRQKRLANNITHGDGVDDPRGRYRR